MSRLGAPEPRVRSVPLTHVALGGGKRRPLPHPVRVRLAGPYEDGLYLAACPDLGLACLGPASAHALGQVEGMIALALITAGEGLNAEGQRLARLLRRRTPLGVEPLLPGTCQACGTPVPLGDNHHVRRYCSPQCRKRDVYARGVYGEERACVMCGGTFHVKRRGSETQTCGPVCAARWRASRRRAKRGGA